MTALKGGVQMSQGIGGLFGGNSWIWILLLLVFVLPSFGSGCGTGGFFGGSNSWLWILVLLIFILPSLGFGKGFGSLGNCFGNLGGLGNLLGSGC